MIENIPSLDRLVHELARLPGIGSKSAQRLAYYILKEDDELSKSLQNALGQVREKIKECGQCFSYTEEADGVCQICSDLNRHELAICVVEQASDVARIEKSGVFRGRYHVLQGTISPLDGVLPQDLTIQALLDKVDASLNSQVPIEEIILVLDADLEGDTTALYLAKLLNEKKVKVTRIAHGVPIGGDIDYVDHRTLGRALENRIRL